VKFTIIIPPKGQMRARSRAISRDGKSFAMTYKAGKQRKEEHRLAALLFEHRPETPMTGPVCLIINAYMPIPESKPKKFKAAALAGIERPTTKPDADNIGKAVLDVMNGVFFQDDKQIVSLQLEKHYGAPARYEISIEELRSGLL
jgi:Holliday junction resolvase RusA-like endonuclease